MRQLLDSLVSAVRSPFRRVSGPPLRSTRFSPWTLALWACGALVLGISYWRLYYGIDLTDESYYVAVPYRFVLGARPFVDETTTSQQAAALLAYPFLALYHATVGVGGIVLFARHLHFVFSCVVAACVFVGLRPFVPTVADALLPALLPIAFVPFNLPDPSYNTLGSGFLVTGCFLGIRSFASSRLVFPVAAGLLHGLAIFAYPTLVIPVVVYASVLAALTRRRFRRVLVPYSVAALVPMVALLSLVADAGIHNVRDIIAHGQEFAGQGGGIHKLLTTGRGVVDIVVGAWIAIPCAVAMLILWRRRPAVAAWLLALLPLLLIPLGDVRDYFGSLNYVTIFGLLALPLFLLLRDCPSMQTLFLAIWPVALIAGIATAWTSDNGAINFGLGFLPAPIVTMVLLAAVFRRARRAAAKADQLPLAAFVTASGALAVLLALQFTSVYRDGGFRRLDSRIAAGPYAGIYTTHAKRRFIQTMTTDLRRRAPSTCRILFYDNFPAGYLLTSSRAYTNAVWLFRVASSKVSAYRRILLRYYRSEGGLPDVVVRMTAVPTAAGKVLRVTYSPQDPLDRLVSRSGTYRLVTERADYGVYHRRGAPCLKSQ